MNSINELKDIRHDMKNLLDCYCDGLRAINYSLKSDPDYCKMIVGELFNKVKEGRKIKRKFDNYINSVAK